MGQIIEVLTRLGGSAHRDEVIAQIVRARGLTDANQIARLRAQVQTIFVAHCEAPEDPPHPRTSVFRQVFGPDSRRWGLSKTAERALRHGGIDLDRLSP